MLPSSINSDAPPHTHTHTERSILLLFITLSTLSHFMLQHNSIQFHKRATFKSLIHNHFYNLYLFPPYFMLLHSLTEKKRTYCGLCGEMRQDGEMERRPVKRWTEEVADFWFIFGIISLISYRLRSMKTKWQSLGLWLVEIFWNNYNNKTLFLDQCTDLQNRKKCGWEDHFHFN